ncbi:MAG: TerC family protein [Sphingobacteriales bacterium]|jgi:tellurite resistance protein TerC|nr:TerC family protein [Sphingobacteriales bacterium]
MSNELLFISSFAIFIVLMLAFDLGVFNKKDHVIKYREAVIMSLIWVCFALAFYVLLTLHGEWIHGVDSMDRLREVVMLHKHNINIIPTDYLASLELYRSNLALEFITGYLIEYALSVDNIFVIVLVFTAFSVREKYYHRVLFWGILGAIIMRFLFIFLGATMIREFEWILYLFGAFLVYTGVMMFVKRNEEEKIETENHPAVKFASKLFKVFPRYVGRNFFVRKGGVNLVTPLFIVLIVIEFTDLIFAVDSIPAIFSVTKDPYIVFFSNIFAILGLRSMFFLLVNVIHQFHYLKIGLSVLLTFIGVKMLAHDWLHSIGFETIHSLIVIVLILALSIIASLVFPKKEHHHA